MEGSLVIQKLKSFLFRRLSASLLDAISSSHSFAISAGRFGNVMTVVFDVCCITEVFSDTSFSKLMPFSGTSQNEYLLLLEYIPESGVYNILCDGYGARVIEDKKVYNIIKDEYVAISEIKAITETELEFATKQNN